MGPTRALPQRGRDLVGLGHVQRGTIDDTKGFPEIKSTPAYGQRDHHGAWTGSYLLGRWGAWAAASPLAGAGAAVCRLQRGLCLLLTRKQARRGLRRAAASSGDVRVLTRGSS